MIFGFLLAIAADPWIWQWSTQPRWALLALALPWLCAAAKPEKGTAAHTLGAALIVLAFLSLMWTPNRWDAGNGLIVLMIISLSFILGARRETLAPIFCGFALGLWASVFTLVMQTPRTGTMIAAMYPHALFGNRNMLGEIGALVALGLIAYRRWWYLPAPLLCLLWFNPWQGIWPSRGALLAFACGLATIIWQRSRAYGVVTVLLGLLVLSISLNFGIHLSSVHERLTIWSGTLSQLNLFGHGLGSYYTLSPYFIPLIDATTQRVEHAHNELLEIWFELGPIGVGCYIAFIACVLLYGDRRLLPTLVCFLIISLVAFPWHIPANAFIGALVLGRAIRGGPSLRRVLDDGRDLLRERLYARSSSGHTSFRRAETRWEA